MVPRGFDTDYVAPGNVIEPRKSTQSGNAALVAESPEMYEIVRKLATFDWLGEAELSDLVKRCRKIVAAIEGRQEDEGKS